MKFSLGLILLMPGVFLWAAYRVLVRFFPGLALGLYAEHQAIAGVVAAFAFTMIGFLTTIAVFMLGFYESKTFLRFRQRGHFTPFMIFYLCSVLSLMLTFLSALISYTDLESIGRAAFNVMLGNTFNNVVQLFLVSFAAFNMAVKSSKEGAE